VKTVSIPVASPDDNSADFFAKAYENGWTDGLPVIPPTPARVEVFIEAAGLDPDKIVATMPPLLGVATARVIAANAVMAGCLPEYFPIVLAAVEAISDPRFPLATFVGQRPETPFILVNGPIRQKIGLQCGRGSLGPGWRANATIGRAIRLIMINVAGLKPGVIARSCFASPLQYSFCAGEDEENSPWAPFHVDEGLRQEQSAVSLFRATECMALFPPLDWTDQSPLGLLEQTGRSMGSVGNTAIYGGSLSCLVLLNHERARMFADAGISKAEAKALLHEYSMLPCTYFRKADLEALTRRGRVIGDKVSLVDGPEDINIAVTGGAGMHTVYVPGIAHETLPRKPVVKPVVQAII
jgi:hypothetical protein